MVAATTEPGVSGHSERRAPSRTAHAGVGALGIAALAYMALPVASDGLMNSDRLAIVLLAVSGTVLALVGGLVEGLALRAGYRTLALACLIAFALVAVFPPGLMPGKWFESALEPGSSEALGLALVAWVLTVELEYLVANTIGRRKALANDSGAS